MPAAVNHTGKRFARLIAIERIAQLNELTRYRCLCDCGEETIINTGSLTSGQTKSCGCLNKEQQKYLAPTRRLKHGHAKRDAISPEYTVWYSMIKRCEDIKHPHYNNYGGRGIKVCERWRNSFENFLADMGSRPAGLTLDRKENNDNYEPSNCRWATRLEQAANKRKKG